MKVILVAGVHGVGKSTKCREASQKLGIASYTASQIIKDEKASPIPTLVKYVEDLDENQRFLIQGISKLPDGECILLDGHLTLFIEKSRYRAYTNTGFSKSAYWYYSSFNRNSRGDR
jgi:adenylate kinase